MINKIKQILNRDQVAAFNKDGFLQIPDFYDIDKEIAPVQHAIYKIIGILLKKYKVDFEQSAFSLETFDSGYQQLISFDRKIGSIIYDAVKHIPAFVRLSCCEKHDSLMMQLRETDLPGVPLGGFGIRIDNPFEEKFRANWHQDYPSQFRSIDGLVFWAPLVSINDDIGPLQVAVASHNNGVLPIHTKDSLNPEKTGAYALRLKNEDEVVKRYPKVQGYSKPGDLIIIDYLNLHASGRNSSTRSRWSMQMRYFNYRDPVGQSYNWVGSFAEGRDIQSVHPDLIVK